MSTPERIFIVADRDGPYSEFMYPFKAQDDDIGYIREDLAPRVGLERARQIVKKVDAEGALYNDDEILTSIILLEIEKAIGEHETHSGN